jgi:ATP-dependent helicase/nuclease subunit A
LTEEQRDMLNVEKLSNFLSGELFDRIINSTEYFREFQFTVKINACEFDKDIDNSLKEQKITMQGAVDLAFVENDELVIVDYKTDRVKDIALLGEMYAKQLMLYKSAMEQSTGLQVKEMYIYSFNLNQTLKL